METYLAMSRAIIFALLPLRIPAHQISDPSHTMNATYSMNRVICGSWHYPSFGELAQNSSWAPQSRWGYSPFWGVINTSDTAALPSLAWDGLLLKVKFRNRPQGTFQRQKFHPFGKTRRHLAILEIFIAKIRHIPCRDFSHVPHEPRPCKYTLQIDTKGFSAPSIRITFDPLSDNQYNFARICRSWIDRMHIYLIQNLLIRSINARYAYKQFLILQLTNNKQLSAAHHSDTDLCEAKNP